LTDNSKRGFSLQSILSRLTARRREARAIRQLRDLSDSMLRDIGLTRWDVEAAISGSGRFAPSKSLDRAASENRILEAANAGCCKMSGQAGNLRLAA
jgi:uncharacterized protein YjiS (DUF1127 family)